MNCTRPKLVGLKSPNPSVVNVTATGSVAAVRERLQNSDPTSGTEPREAPTDVAGEETTLADLREQTFFGDAAPTDPSVLNEDADGTRTLDELF